MPKPKKNRKQTAVKAPQKMPSKNGADEVASIPAGAVPQIVSQRVYDYIPAFFNALKEIHAELVAIKEALKED